MQARTTTFFLVGVSALVLSSFAFAGGTADPDYPQMSHSTQSRDAVSDQAVRANNSIHPTEVAESQPAPVMAGLTRAQVHDEAVRANNAMHSTEVPESQVAPMMSAHLQAPGVGINGS